MKDRNIVIAIIIISIIISVVAFFITYDKENKIKYTYIYDINGKEIDIINYGDVSYFDRVKSYYMASALEDILEDIMEKENISEDEAEEKLVTGGYKIYLCEDMTMQNKLEEIYLNSIDFPDNFESATIILDNGTGEVRAVVGGRNLNDQVITFGEFNKTHKVTNSNIATDASVRPGYMFSNISVYACGMSNGIFKLDTTYNLEEYYNNSSYRKYDLELTGDVSIKRGIEEGLNIIKILAFNDIGIDKCVEFLELIGISTITEEDKSMPALVIGEFNDGVKLIELSSAYRTILVDGEYKEPIFYTKVLDKEGNTYIEREQENRFVMDKSICDDLKSCCTENEGSYYKQSMDSSNTVHWCNVVNDEYTYTSVCYTNDTFLDIDRNNNFATNIITKILDMNNH